MTEPTVAVMPRLIAAALCCLVLAATAVALHGTAYSSTSDSSRASRATSHAKSAVRPAPSIASRSLQRYPIERLHLPKPRPSHSARPARTSPTTAVSSAGSARGYARKLVGDAQFSCLEPMWDNESGWSTTEVNSSSGAAGIPQFLPSTWADYGYAYYPNDFVTQIKAGLRYIADRYGSPCSAWAFWQAHHWY